MVPVFPTRVGARWPRNVEDRQDEMVEEKKWTTTRMAGC